MVHRSAAYIFAMILLLSGIGNSKAVAAPDVEMAPLAHPRDLSVEAQQNAENLQKAITPCITPNNRPVAPCTDWITGPGSVENSDIKMFRWDAGPKKWQPATLFETDQGWPVMSPDGKRLELMVYGDTFVKNPNYSPGQRNIDIKACAAKDINTICGASKDCQTIFEILAGDKAEACAYWLAKHYQWHPAKTRGLSAFDKRNNVVFFDAEIDEDSDYRIRFKEHLYDKMVHRNTMENTSKTLKNPITGIYTADYFYLCPGAAVKCWDEEKVLYFVTGTVHWHVWQTNASLLTKEEKLFKITRQGTGFYRFGTLGAKTDKTPGCRVAFASPKGQPPVSCAPRPGQDLHVKHPMLAAPGVEIKQSANPHVLWGWGNRFATPIVMHGYTDPRSTGQDRPGTYVYFLGVGEHLSLTVGNPAMAVYLPTTFLYLARIRANEAALLSAQFEYYTGTSDGQSKWGSYSKAKIIHWTGSGGSPTSFTKRFGRYYLASFCLPDENIPGRTHGMCVLSSADGYAWGKEEFVTYSDILGSEASTKWVYGHMWMPEGLYPHDNAIAYVFSVEKAPKGYAADFWFNGRDSFPLKLEKRFHSYNTKMYLYTPPN